MTNFLAELWDVVEDVPTLKMPVAVLVLIVFIVPVMLFALLIELVDLILQWTWNGVYSVVRIVFDLAIYAGVTYMASEALLSGDLIGTLVGFGFVSVVVFILITDSLKPKKEDC